MTEPKVGFVGAGTLARALAPAFAEAGVAVTAIASRTLPHAQALADALPHAVACRDLQQVVDRCELVFLTVPDDAIAPVCGSLAWTSASSAVHCSGAHSLAPLDHARGLGADVGAFHPLQTLAHAGRSQPFRNVSFAVEASSEKLAETLAGFAERLGGVAGRIDGTDKPLYHAGAVLASNYVVTLLSAAAALWCRFGATRERGLEALLPLVRGTIDNLEAVGFPDALTGPIARGDIDTVRLHLDVLRAREPQLLPLYCRLGRRTVALAVEKGGIDETVAAKLHALLVAQETEGTPA